MPELVANFHPAFKEAAYKELAQGRFKDNESLAFVEIPDYLMADAQWAWDAGWKACLNSMGLTPQRLHELEAEYHAALEPVGDRYADDLPRVPTTPKIP